MSKAAQRRKGNGSPAPPPVPISTTPESLGAAPPLDPLPSTSSPAPVASADEVDVEPGPLSDPAPLLAEEAPVSSSPSLPSQDPPAPEASAAPAPPASVVTMNEPAETHASSSSDLADLLAAEGTIVPDAGSVSMMDDDAIEIPVLSDPDELEGVEKEPTARPPRGGRSLSLTHVPGERKRRSLTYEEGETADPPAELTHATFPPRAEPALSEASDMTMTGMVLTCADFQGEAVAGTVEHESESAVLVRFEDGREWPVWKTRITGTIWQYVAGDAPAPGKDPDFDARYRKPAAATIFKPPAGHVRARITAKGFTSVKGFSLKGVLTTMWRAGEEGFFPAAIVDHPKSHLERAAFGAEIKALAPAPAPKPVLGPIHPPLPTAAEVAAVRAPMPQFVQGIPEGYLKARVRSPGGAGAAVAVRGVRETGSPKSVWTHGEVGYFPPHAVRCKGSNLIEMGPAPSATAAPPAPPLTSS